LGDHALSGYPATTRVRLARLSNAVAKYLKNFARGLIMSAKLRWRRRSRSAYVPPWMKPDPRGFV
jgi:hypothetical protein